eukprot:Opistho-2@3879
MAFDASEAGVRQPTLTPFTHRFSIGEGLIIEQSMVVFPEHELDSGAILKNVDVGFKTWGSLNANGDNVIVVCHALTGHADVSNWWEAIIGPGRTLDSEKYFIFCANVLGSPYGTASPVTYNPDTGLPYGADFPQVTVRDTVRLHKRVLDHVLGVRRVHAVIGASLGGMQALEWGFFWRRLHATHAADCSVCKAVGMVHGMERVSETGNIR